MNAMLNPPSTVEQLSALGCNKFKVAFHLTENAVVFSPVLSRIELAKLVQLGSEALRATQDQVQDPSLLAAVVVAHS